MQQEYVRMKCLSKAFCIHLVSLCISALNHCTVNRLLKMFVLLPTATISRRNYFHFPDVHTHTHTMRTFWYHLFILFNDRIESDNAVANNSTLLNEMKFGDRETTRDVQQQRDNTIQQQSFVTTKCCREGLALRGSCRWEPCLWKLSRFAAAGHPTHLKFFILDTIMLLLCSLGCRVYMYLSPETDDLIELCLWWNCLHIADKDTSQPDMHVFLNSFLFWQTALCSLFISLHHCPSLSSKRSITEKNTKYSSVIFGIHREERWWRMLGGFESISQG